MTNRLYDTGETDLGAATIDWENDDIRVLLVRRAYVPDFAAHEDLADIPAAQRLAVSGATTGRGLTGSAYTIADDVEITGTGGGIAYGVVIYLHTGSDSTSTLISFVESAVGLPATITAGETKTLEFSGSFTEGALTTPVPEIVTSPLVETASEIVILVDVVYVDSNGANPVTFRFSDLFYHDSTTDPITVYRPLIKSLGRFGFTRVTGTKLRGGSTPDGGSIKILPTPELLSALDGLNCERQSLVVRKGRPGDPLTRFRTVWTGIAEGDERSGSSIGIQAFNAAKLFEVDYQPRRWEGRGRRLRMSFAGAGEGRVEVDAPADGSWDAATSMVATWVGEFDVAAGTFDNVLLDMRDSGGSIVWLLTRTTAGKAGVLWGSSSHTGTADISAAGLYRIGVFWDGATLRTFVDGTEDVSVSEASFPGTSSLLNIGADAALVGFVKNDVSVEDVKLFVDGDATAAYLEAPGSYDDPEGDETPTGLVLNLPLSEGVGGRTYDPERAHVGRLVKAATWESTRTGDVELKGRRQPSTFGFVEDAQAILIDKIEQVYAVHHAEVGGTIVPKVGGRRLAGRWSSSTGTVVFSAAARTISHDSGILSDLQRAVPYQTIRIAGSASNDGDYSVVRDPWFDGTSWFVQVAEEPVDETGTLDAVSITSVAAYFTEVSTNAEGSILVSGVPQDVSRSITGDFDQFARTFTSSSDLSAFPIWSLVQVTGGANDGEQYRLTNSPYFDAATSKWTLFLNIAPTSETAAAVTIATLDTGGEYITDLANGQFTLYFVPTKPVTAQVSEPDTFAPGLSGDTAPEIGARMMAQMGSSDSQALSVNSAHLAELATAYPWQCGIYDSGDEDTTLAQALDFVFQGVGLHWFVSPRTGVFSACDLPPTTSEAVTKYLTAQTGATGLSPKRAHKARAYVEVLWGRNRLPLELSDMDFYVQFDRSPSAQAVVHNLRKEWQSARYPETPTDDSLEPDTIESPVANRQDAEALAESLYTRLMGHSNSFYEIDGLLEWQDVEPWLVELQLTDAETPGLATSRAAYLVMSTDENWSTKLLAVVIED